MNLLVRLLRVSRWNQSLFQAGPVWISVRQIRGQKQIQLTTLLSILPPVAVT